MAKVTQVDFPPRETVSYTKETQTPAPAQAKEGDLCFFFFFRWFFFFFFKKSEIHAFFNATLPCLYQF